MKVVAKFALVFGLASVFSGCSADSPDKAASDARSLAADARVAASDADARVAAADAHVKAADARVKAADAGVVAADADVRAKSRTDGASGAKAVIPSGSVLKVSLIDAVGSDTSVTGDHFLTSLTESFMADGATLLPRGTKLRGRVINVQEPGKVKGLASIQLQLTDIVQGNRMIPISTETFAATAESTQTRDAEVVGGGAGIGAVIGAIAGGKKGAAIGAITGGGAGTGIVLGTRGRELHYDPETLMNFTLKNSVQL